MAGTGEGTLEKVPSKAEGLWAKLKAEVGAPLLADDPHHREIRAKIETRCKEIMGAVHEKRCDPTVVDVPHPLRRFCNGKEQVPKPSWLTPDFIFNAAHYLALFVAVYGILWSGLSMAWGDVLTGPLWMPLQLLKLGYPMVPVVLGCWIARHQNDSTGAWRKMTPGYYFANLKMCLMVSLGAGFLIGAGGKVLVLKLLGIEHIVGTTYSEFLLPVAWLLGCLLWGMVASSFYAKFGGKFERAERCRQDWGYYARWVVVPEDSKPWEEWIRAGPHWLAGVIPAARHGTFHKIGEADKLRAIGITLCTAVAWVSMIVLALAMPGIVQTFDQKDAENSCVAILIHTDAPNLITNTLTAPFLIYSMWRPEPNARDFFQAAMRVAGQQLATEVDDRNGQPWVLYANRKQEEDEVINQVVAEIVLVGAQC